MKVFTQRNLCSHSQIHVKLPPQFSSMAGHPTRRGALQTDHTQALKDRHRGGGLDTVISLTTALGEHNPMAPALP